MLKKDLPWLIIIIFLAVRLVLNLIPPINSLFLTFAAIYLIFIIWQIKELKYFKTSLIIFLSLDAILGAYFFALGNLPELEFYGTIAVNIFIILILLRDPKNNFKD